MHAGGTVYDQLARDVYGPGFTTMFWLPATDTDADQNVIKELDVSAFVADDRSREQLTRFIEQEVSVLLPFLSNLEEVSLYLDRHVLATAQTTGNRKSVVGDEVQVKVVVAGTRSDASFFQMHGTAIIPPGIRKDPQTPKAVLQMDHANFRLSVRLSNGNPVFDPTARFHVYFPTEEPTGFGVTVHGDFSVKPDRTRLMGGQYNAWLLESIANMFAGAFLTRLLNRYGAKAVFESLAPSLGVSHEAAREFQSFISRVLRKRTEPFIPSRTGMLAQGQVALPSAVDATGFWDSRFAESVAEVTGKAAFIEPSADSEEARRFLVLAGVQVLRDEVFLDLLENRARTKPMATWWYEVYSFLAVSKRGALWKHDTVAGRYVLPDQDLATIAVPLGAFPVLCLPPADDASIPAVPICFRSSFVFLNAALSYELHHGPDNVLHWLLNTCRIAQFEATELLPKAIVATVQKFYDGTIKLTASDLASLWGFLRKIIAASRSIKSEQFWQSVGRLPLPLIFDPASNEPIATSALAPAFLCYWDSDDGSCRECIRGITNYRRLSMEFVPYLVSVFGGNAEEWRLLIEQAGVSGTPKLLRYVRPIGGGREVPFVARMPHDRTDSFFSGERQRDENLIVLENLRNSAAWEQHVASFSSDERDGRALQEILVVDQLAVCVDVAVRVWKTNQANGNARLWSLLRHIPVHDVRELGNDQVFRRLSAGGGATVNIRSFLKAQIDELPWGPSSLGPVSPSTGFLRLVNRRFVSHGAGGEELGDQLVPYVVAARLDDYDRLVRLGFESLEEGSASPQTLVRFLQFTGERLSEDWGKELLGTRSRWRLVRGAIQECYRILNQAEPIPGFPFELKLAAKVGGRISFVRRPLFFAEVGSPLERAFADTIPLFDADRVYQSLFKDLDIHRLIVGQTVSEEFCGDARSAPSSALRDSIVNELGPYLLAVVIAKSEDRGHRDLVLRRLRERFEVYVADRLTIKFTLHAARGVATLERSIDFSKFYVRRRALTTTGALREMNYALHVVSPDNVKLSELDGDSLGDALTAIFFDAGRDDISAMFPRIVSRYQTVHGSHAAMEQFLLESLGVSLEAQLAARDDIIGKPEEAPSIDVSPPPTIIVPSLVKSLSQEDETDSSKLDEHKENASDALNRIIDALKPEHDDQKEPIDQTSHPRPPVIIRRPTREQEVRGKKGEEEFLRRIGLAGGWWGGRRQLGWPVDDNYLGRFFTGAGPVREAGLS